jgi:hypothetical protein
MKNLKLFLALLVLALVISACSAFETGGIVFVDPDPTGKSTIHEDAETGIQWIPVSIDSTFENTKLATITVGSFSYSCHLATGRNVCDPAPISEPGEYTLRAEVFKQDGVTVVPIETVVKWQPWSKMDKVMQFLDPENPIPGYGVTIFLMACIAAGIFGTIFGSKWGAILGFILSLIGLAMFFQQSGATLLAGQVITLIYSLFGLACFAFVMHLWFTSKSAIHLGPKVIVRDGDQEIEMSEIGYLGPAENGPDLSRMGDSASKAISAGKNPMRLPKHGMEYIEAEVR